MEGRWSIRCCFWYDDNNVEFVVSSRLRKSCWVESSNYVILICYWCKFGCSVQSSFMNKVCLLFVTTDLIVNDVMCWNMNCDSDSSSIWNNYLRIFFSKLLRFQGRKVQMVACVEKFYLSGNDRWFSVMNMRGRNNGFLMQCLILWFLQENIWRL